MANGYPEGLRDEVERYLAELRFSSEPRTAGLEDAMRYSLLAGGKRIRPILCLETYVRCSLPFGSTRAEFHNL